MTDLIACSVVACDRPAVLRCKVCAKPICQGHHVVYTGVGLDGQSIRRETGRCEACDEAFTAGARDAQELAAARAFAAQDADGPAPIPRTARMMTSEDFAAAIAAAGARPPKTWTLIESVEITEMWKDRPWSRPVPLKKWVKRSAGTVSGWLVSSTKAITAEGLVLHGGWTEQVGGTRGVWETFNLKGSQQVPKDKLVIGVHGTAEQRDTWLRQAAAQAGVPLTY